MTERMKQMFPEELQEMLQVVCPETYRKKLFLTQADIQSILEISRTKSYEILRNAPFRVEKIGAQIRVPAYDFWLWYLGSGAKHPDQVEGRQPRPVK